MISSRDFKTVIIGILLVTFVSVGMYFLIKKDMVCDEHVVLEDGKEYNCRSVSSYSNGMSCINMCDGERICVPTHRIKIITPIKN
jgi:hypothetical protein